MAARAGRLRLTAGETLWYVLGCISFGGMYFAKIPAKKALSEAGLAQMTVAERFWYVLQCIPFGAGYFAKIPVKKALTEMTRVAMPSDGWGPGPAALDQLEQPGQQDDEYYRRPDPWPGRQGPRATDHG